MTSKGITHTVDNWPLTHRAECMCGAVVETFDRVAAELWIESHRCAPAS